MPWSEQTEEALHRWLAPGTWYKEHPLDDARFSVFVAWVWNDEHSIWNEPRAREIITEKAVELHPGHDDLATQTVETRVSQGTAILDFLCHVRDKGQLALLSQ